MPDGLERLLIAVQTVFAREKERAGTGESDLLPKCLDGDLRERDLRDAVWRLRVGNPYLLVFQIELFLFHRRQLFSKRPAVSLAVPSRL